MSDLISRKSILDKLENILLNANLTIGEHTLLTGVINEISIEPTAYDVSKVESELEEMKGKSLSSYDYETMKIAIDIVRKGGVKWQQWINLYFGAWEDLLF